MQDTWVESLGCEDPPQKEMATYSVFLLGKPHGQRSMVGQSPWSCKESDTTEQLETVIQVYQWSRKIKSGIDGPLSTLLHSVWLQNYKDDIAVLIEHYDIAFGLTNANNSILYQIVCDNLCLNNVWQYIRISFILSTFTHTTGGSQL